MSAMHKNRTDNMGLKTRELIMKTCINNTKFDLPATFIEPTLQFLSLKTQTRFTHKTRSTPSPLKGVDLVVSSSCRTPSARISMAESSSSSRKSNLQKVLTEPEMAAAQQLMQLSDEDSYNNNNSSSKKKRDVHTDDEEVDQSRSEITSAMIEELFGKEDACRPKKRRYRSLVSIYTATKPINGRYVREEGKILRPGNLNGVLA